MPKKKHQTVTNSTPIREIVKKLKELDTKPSEDLRKLLIYERLIPVGFKFRKQTPENLPKIEANFSKIKSELHEDIQKLISDPNKIVEIDNYFALSETIRDLRRCAEYLMKMVKQTEESREAFGEMSLGAFNLYQEQRKKLIKKFPPKHEMVKDSRKQWLKNSPYAKARRNPAIPIFISAPTFDANFTLDFESTYLAKLLKGIDARRLRICKREKCSHVFWAYQLNQIYCNKTCQNNAKRNRSYHKNKNKGENE